MFTPFSLRGLTVMNRVVMSPMCMYSADDGTVNDFHLVHLGSRAMGGAGLVFTEMTNVERAGRISPGCAGIYKPEHVAPWKRVVDFVHGHTAARIGIQLGHAGRKASTRKSWEGNNQPLETGNWQIFAPSSIPYLPESQAPKAMDRDDLDRVRAAYAAAARRADEAGFDIIELHAGHGYLLSSFISPLTNKRDDDYGGPVENRMRFPLECLAAVREAWPDDKPISARISAVDWVEGGTTEDDAVVIAGLFKDAGLDILDVSTGNVIEGARPTVTGLFQTPYSEKIRAAVGIPTMTVGNISGPGDINDIIAEGRADLCVVGKGHLYDPYFTRHAARALEADGPTWPNQYLRGAEAFTPGY
jgi:anthraniloyl-CoA monooxygenase